MSGRATYIQLGQDDRFGWTEPEGKVYQIAADNLVRLKDEIYRVCYLMKQAGSSSGGDLRMSGLSKQRDFSVTQEILRAYGDMVKDAMKQVLRAIAEARQDDVSIDVSGLDEFDIGDFSNELDDAKKLLDLGIESETLKKQVFKKLAFKYLCDARQEIKNRIAEEIDGRVGTAKHGSGGIWKASTYKTIVQQAVQEFVSNEQAKSEPAYKAELQEERKRREQLERRLNELVEENKRSREVAEEAERGSAIRAELQRLGVARSTWRSERCRTGSCGPRTGGW